MENILKIAAQKLRYLSLTTYYNHYKKQPINQKQVLFLSQSRKELSGNFYYIHQAMQDRFIVKSVLSDDSITNKMLARLMAESHYILLDDFYPAIYPVHLREETTACLHSRIVAIRMQLSLRHLSSMTMPGLFIWIPGTFIPLAYQEVISSLMKPMPNRSKRNSTNSIPS